jgi:hypothetical protein
MIVDLPAGRIFVIWFTLETEGKSRYDQSTIPPAYYPQQATKKERKKPNDK